MAGVEPRAILKSIESREQSEGAGARVRRAIGGASLPRLDPFLMMDEFNVGLPAGFPDHPHRGFETVTYMLNGTFTHEDFVGNSGIIAPGDLQWMTAGRGICHSEIPAPGPNAHGLQLWINLSSKDKMIKPAYQEMMSKDLTRVSGNGVEATVIAGECLGARSQVYTRNPTMFLDLTMDPHARLDQHVPKGWNGFVYVLEGSATFGSSNTKGEPHHTLQLGPGDSLVVHNSSNSRCRFVLLAGQPVGEPVEQYGPFVMNTRAEINQAMRDYQNGKNGFEGADAWTSKNRHFTSNPALFESWKANRSAGDSKTEL
eukprot:CAMPEP_0114289414 /NCGR_PEP_ID=MMETSP0059-20121206/7360_1 /TAXON_ID=36894 /ORGANISM="Pyramimonas parkeae, Strain CCMP726" /LENGTH=313 /DNA_ID=CAMNT_0001410683 /DNA_START=152 /DNA_END=1093 /DNA_ORIENTATION=-